MADTSNKKNIREESLRDLSDFLTAQGEKAFRAKQIWQWIWQRGVTDFAEMSNLSKATRELLSRHYFFDTLGKFLAVIKIILPQHYSPIVFAVLQNLSVCKVIFVKFIYSISTEL